MRLTLRLVVASSLLLVSCAAVLSTPDSSESQPSPPSLILAAATSAPSAITDTTSYLARRNDLITQNRRLRFDADVILDDTEVAVNRYLLDLRAEEFAQYRPTRSSPKIKASFPGAVYFSIAKPEIEKSNLFGIIRRMPKGASLHVHIRAAGRADWIISKVAELGDTTRVFWPAADQSAAGGIIGKLVFGGITPEQRAQGYRLVSEVRAEDPEFDTKLFKLITIDATEAGELTAVWEEFGRCGARTSGFIQSPVVRDSYFLDAFRTLIADGIQYVEMRVSNANRSWILPALQTIRAEYPEFDAKIILSTSKVSATPEDLAKDLDIAIRAYRADSNFIIGFDLVGFEDQGRPIIDLIDPLIAAADSIPFYFHAGESDWPDDLNLYDATLLRSRRIGHGFNLFRFPILDTLVAGPDNQIPLELCPVSNQMFHYIADIRDHPAAAYLARGAQAVICSDDPAILGNDGLSYDFWLAFMSWDLDLASLKKLAMNSIEFSGMSDVEKDQHRAFWNQRWKEFIADLAQEIP